MKKIRWKDRFQNYQLAFAIMQETYVCIEENAEVY